MGRGKRHEPWERTGSRAMRVVPACCGVVRQQHGARWCLSLPLTGCALRTRRPLQLRVWGRVVTQDEVKRNMWRARPESEEGLAALYLFDEPSNAEQAGALDKTGAASGALGR